MQQNNVLIKFNIIGANPGRRYIRISNNLLFDFKRDFFFAKTKSENFDVAIDVAKRDYTKLVGFIALRKQIGFKETSFSELTDKSILADYYEVLKNGKQFRVFEDIIKIKSPYYMQASKYINNSYTLINHPVEHFHNLFKAIEVIGAYFVNNINQELAEKLKTMGYSKLASTCEKGDLTRPRLTATSDLTIEKVLKQKLRLNDNTIKYLKLIRTHRNQDTAHGVLDLDILHLSLLHYLDINPSIADVVPRRQGTRMNRTYKLVVDLLFSRFIKYLSEKNV